MNPEPASAGDTRRRLDYRFLFSYRVWVQHNEQTSLEDDSNRALADVVDGLFRLPFKTLKRPVHKPDVGRSEKELRWASRLSTCSSMSFFRDMLRSYLSIRKEKLDAISFLAARALFETTAMANYVQMHVQPLLRREKYDQAWDLLYRASLGSYYAREHLSQHEVTVERPIPLHIGKAVKSLTSLDDRASAECSFLSEYSHPDAFALMHYVDLNSVPYFAQFRTYPHANVGYLRNTIGATVAIASIVYRNLFIMSEMHTARRLLEATMGKFLDAESRRDRTGLVPHGSE
jgi:hypothetical protein